MLPVIYYAIIFGLYQLLSSAFRKATVQGFKAIVQRVCACFVKPQDGNDEIVVDTEE